MIRTALIGLSGYARTHLLMAMEQALHGRLQLVAATVINQEEEAFLCQRLASLGCRIHADTDAMWREHGGAIDLCLIPTGIPLHASMTIAALRHGANVLVEKPLAPTLADVDAIQAAEAATGHWVAVGFQDLYTPAAQWVKKQLGARTFGPLRRITTSGIWPRPSSYYTRNAWAGRLKVGATSVYDSPVNNAFAHFLNLALYWAGPGPDSATVTALESSLWRTQPIESFDTAALRATTAEGVPLLAYFSHAATEFQQARLVVECERAQLTWTHLKQLDVAWADGRKETIRLLGSTEARFNMMDAVVGRFADPAGFVCTSGLARAHTEVVARLHAHARIHDVPANCLETSGSAGDPQIAISGLAAGLAEAARRHLLPEELGLPWTTGAAGGAGGVRTLSRDQAVQS